MKKKKIQFQHQHHQKKINTYKELDLENYENKPFSELILKLDNILVSTHNKLTAVFLEINLKMKKY